MVHNPPARRRPARFLVPLALSAVILSTYLVVHHAVLRGSGAVASRHQGSGDHHAGGTRTVTTGTGASTTSTTTTTAGVYVIQPGDTLGAISARTGVSVARIEQLNPGLNPSALQVGQRVRLSP